MLLGGKSIVIATYKLCFCRASLFEPYFYLLLLFPNAERYCLPDRFVVLLSCCFVVLSYDNIA